MTARFLAAYETPAHPEAFDRHYREVRIPLCRQLPELRRYMVSRGAAAVRGTPDYLAAELEWDTVDELRAAFASPQGRATAEDAARLQELPSVRSMIFAADDSMILSRRPRSRGHADTISTETGLHVSLDQGAVPFLQAHSVDVDGEFAKLGSGGYRPMRVPVPNVITGDSQVPVSWGAWRRRTSGAPRSVTSPSRGTAHTGCMQEARATSTPGRRPGHARLPGRQSTIRRNYSVCYSYGVGEWEIYQTDEVADWMGNLRRTDPGAADQVEAAVDVLSEYGPTLGRPLVDTLTGSKIANLKELRPGRR